MKRFIFEGGALREVSKYACTWHVEAPTRTDALNKLAAHGARCIDHPPELKTRNGAWQLATPALDGSWNVDAGTEGRKAVCSSGVKHLRDLTDETASFAYYASDEYRAQSTQ